MNTDVLKLENQLCFPLYASAKEVVKKYKPFLDEINFQWLLFESSNDTSKVTILIW